MKKKPAEHEPPDPSSDEPPPRTVGDVMSGHLRTHLQPTQDSASLAAAKLSGAATLSPLLGAAKLDEGLFSAAPSMAAMTDSMNAELLTGAHIGAAESLKGWADKWAASLGADTVGALADSKSRWAGLIDQATESSRAAHELAGFWAPGSQLSEHPWDDTALATIEPRPDPLPGMSAELSRVSGLVAVMADNVAVMATLGQRAEEALIRLEVEASATRAETERLRGALENGQRSGARLTWVLIVLTVVIAALTLALLLHGA